MKETFGDASRREKDELVSRVKAEILESGVPVARGPKGKKKIIVDEPVERMVCVAHRRVIFRPGQVLVDPYLIRVAEENGIALVEKW